VLGLLAGALVLRGAALPAQAQGGWPKVPVCHKGKTLRLPSVAAQKHLKHGDTPGECGRPPGGGVCPAGLTVCDAARGNLTLCSGGFCVCADRADGKGSACYSRVDTRSCPRCRSDLTCPSGQVCVRVGGNCRVCGDLPYVCASTANCPS
jgi:hypothetical protein